MDTFITSTLNGVSYGLLLFLLSSGLTLIFSMMGVLNFAHASFYMLGAYFAYTLAPHLSFWGALALAPLLVGLLGAVFEWACLRRVHAAGHSAELLLTFGFSYVVVEVVQMVWGRSAVPYRIPEALNSALFTVFGQSFPAYRAFMMALAVLALLAIWLVLTRTRIGLVIQASLTHPEMVECLGHNVPRVFMLVFGGGSALAGLAGAIGGSAFVTEPGMAAGIGAIIFVVIVIGGMGSLAGALLASILIGLLQTYAVSVDLSLGSLGAAFGLAAFEEKTSKIWNISVAQIAPVLPYFLLILVLMVRPSGLMGKRI